jgi:hypothetical protein
MDQTSRIWLCVKQLVPLVTPDVTQCVEVLWGNLHGINSALYTMSASFSQAQRVHNWILFCIPIIRTRSSRVSGDVPRARLVDRFSESGSTHGIPVCMTFEPICSSNYWLWSWQFPQRKWKSKVEICPRGKFQEGWKKSQICVCDFYWRAVASQHQL